MEITLEHDNVKYRAALRRSAKRMCGNSIPCQYRVERGRGITLGNFYSEDVTPQWCARRIMLGAGVTARIIIGH